MSEWGGCCKVLTHIEGDIKHEFEEVLLGWEVLHISSNYDSSHEKLLKDEVFLFIVGLGYLKS